MISFLKKNKIIEIAALIIAVGALCISIVNLTMAHNPPISEEEETQYVIFLGTNDQDTNQPLFSADESKAKAEEILLKHFSGYTIQEASGGWEDGGTLYREYTLVIYLSDTTLDNVHAAADELLQAFNQRSVLIQTNKINTEFYYSKS